MIVAKLRGVSHFIRFHAEKKMIKERQINLNCKRWSNKIKQNQKTKSKIKEWCQSVLPTCRPQLNPFAPKIKIKRD